VALPAAMIRLAREFGRYGDRRITVLLQREGWRGTHNRVERSWRREGLKGPQKQPKRGRLWLTDGSCGRHRPTHRTHVWAYDFVAVRRKDGRPRKRLTIGDEDTRECLAMDVERRVRSEAVLHRLSELFVQHGTPEHIRSDHGPEFAAKAVRAGRRRVGVQTLFIEPGSPWENGYVESCNGKLRDEWRNGEVFETRWEATGLIERWRRTYNQSRPHRSLGQHPPAPEARERRDAQCA
jgi:putative transposase